MYRNLLVSPRSFFKDLRHALVLFIGCLSLSGCVSQYSISEGELEQYLDDEVKFELNEGSGLFGIKMKLNDIQVSLGDKPNMMAVTAVTRVHLQNPLLPVATNLSTRFEAEPWYDAQSHSVYLRKLDLVDVSSSPKALGDAVKNLVPQLMTFLRYQLEQQPIYVLDIEDENQSKIAELVKEIKVLPGELVLKFK